MPGLKIFIYYHHNDFVQLLSLGTECTVKSIYEGVRTAAKNVKSNGEN